MDQERLLKVVEVAQRLRVTRGMVDALISRGQLPAIRVGKLWRIKESDLEAFLQRHYTGEADGHAPR